MQEYNVLDALSTTVISMALVFILLIFLMGVIYLQTFLVKVLGNIKRDKNKEKVELAKIDVKDEQDSESTEEASQENELELVAAIMAAISAYTDVPQEKLAIKSIKRLNTNNSNWGTKSF